MKEREDEESCDGDRVKIRDRLLVRLTSNSSLVLNWHSVSHSTVSLKGKARETVEQTNISQPWQHYHKVACALTLCELNAKCHRRTVSILTSEKPHEYRDFF